jgi:hypothetical protein
MASGLQQAPACAPRDVLRVAEFREALASLLARFALQVRCVDDGCEIPGSYWGETEAGLAGNVLYVRAETPVHSALHEACHFICMDDARRNQLHRDAGGDYEEENAVCYLQIVLADELPGVGRARMQADMDAWGYTFRLGSARGWFESDAADARAWLVREGLLDGNGRVLWRVRRG